MSGWPGFCRAFRARIGTSRSRLPRRPPADLLRQLDAGEIEMAVLNPMSGLDSQFHVQDLYRERYIVFFPPKHRLGQLNAVKLADLSGEPYIDRLACEMREMVMQVCQEWNIELYARFRSEREDWVQAMVLAQIGFAFVPEYSVTLPDLMQRPLIDPVVSRTISLVNVPGRRFSPAAAAMARAVQAFDWPG